MERGYRDAMFNMARLNRTAGNLMNMYGAHGATEVAGLPFFLYLFIGNIRALDCFQSFFASNLKIVGNCCIKVPASLLCVMKGTHTMNSFQDMAFLAMQNYWPSGSETQSISLFIIYQ